MGEQADTGELTDEQLLERHRRGGEDAFPELVRRYRSELFPFLLRYVGEPSTAEDLFQEAFLQVHLSADTFDASRRFRPWLFTIAANKARDYLRRTKRQESVPLSASIRNDEDEPEYVDLMAADLPLPQEAAESAETYRLVQQVAAEMPDHLREILLLAYFHQFSYKQIAEILEVPLGTVKSRLHAAVATFAGIWKQRYGQRDR